MTYAWEPELPALAALSDADAAATINAMEVTEVVSHFGSYRTLAAILTQEEYATLKTTLAGAVESSPMVADMVAMLGLPGDSEGNGGGIDFGNATVRAMVDQLATAEVAAKIKAIAEVTRKKYSTPAKPGHVQIVRENL